MKRYRYEILSGFTDTTNFQIPIFLEASVDEMGIMSGFDGEFEQIEQFANFTYKPDFTIPMPSGVTPTPTPSISKSSCPLNPSPTPSVTVSTSVPASPSPTPTYSITPTPTVSGTPCDVTPTVTPTRTLSISLTPTSSISVTPTVTPTISISRTPSISITRTPSISVSTTPGTSPTLTPTISITRTPSISVTPSITITPSTSSVPLPTKFNGVTWVNSTGLTNNYLVGGAFTTYNDNTVGRLVELDSSGNIVTPFTGGTGFDGDVRGILVTSDNKYLIGGAFSSYSGASSNGLIRLNSDGTIDNTFDVGTGFAESSNLYISTIIESGTTYMVGGRFIEYNGDTTVSKLLRLNTDGSIDYTFTGTTKFNAPSDVTDFIITSDNKYLVGGTFLEYSGVTLTGMVKLNLDGTIDDTFAINNITSVNTAIQAVLEPSNGGYIFGGGLTEYSGVTVNRLVKLNTDGTIDNTFQLGGFNSDVRDVIETSNNKLLVVGSFSSYSGVTAGGAIKLNLDGTIDDTFDVGAGFGSTVWRVSETQDSKYLMTGFFTTFQGSSHNRIVKLDTDGTLIW